MSLHIEQRRDKIRSICLAMSDLLVGYRLPGYGTFESVSINLELAVVDAAIALLAHERGEALSPNDEVRIKGALLNTVRGFKPEAQLRRIA